MRFLPHVKSQSQLQLDAVTAAHCTGCDGVPAHRFFGRGVADRSPVALVSLSGLCLARVGVGGGGQDAVDRAGAVDLKPQF